MSTPEPARPLYQYLDSLDEAALVLGADTALLHLNPAAEQFMGYSRDKLKLQELLPEQKNQSFWTSFKNRISDPQTEKSEFIRVSLEADLHGKTYKLNGRLTCLHDQQGGLLCVLLIPVFGIAPPQKESVPAASTTLPNTSRSEFIGMAVHDLRTPVHKIQLACEVLGSNDIAEEKRADFIAMIQRSAVGMSGLIDDLLDLTKFESGKVELKKQDLRFSSYLSTICSEAALLAGEKEIQFAWECDENVGIVHFDPKRISQVLNNLLSNAFKFSSPGTAVEVHATRNDFGLEVSIIDQGPGIPTEEIPKLFDAFSKSRNRPTGGEQSTGLGLAVSRKIIELHGGSIGVDSEVGTGSRFYFTIPDKNNG